MIAFLEFAKSDVGVGIAWICTVFSTVYALYTSFKSKSMAKEIVGLKKVIDQSKTFDSGSDAVIQSGNKNVYTKHNSGGIKINM